MKTLSPEEVCYVPDDLVEEGQERKLQKVSKFNDVVVYEDEEKTVDDDFDFAQDTIRETIMKSNEVLQELGQAAILNENGKLYESYSQLMKNIIDGSAQLIDIHGKKKKIKEVKEPKQNNTQVNNLIVGSTKELLEMIESNK